jgi:hypothetical protein
MMFSACEIKELLPEDTGASNPVIRHSYPVGSEATENLDENDTIYYPEPVYPVDFSISDTIILYGLNNQNVYLVKVNTSGNPVDADNAGTVASYKVLPSPTNSKAAESNGNYHPYRSGRLPSAGEERRNHIPYDMTAEINKEINDAIRSGRLRRSETPPSDVNAGAVLRNTAAQARASNVSESLKYFYILENGQSSLVSATLAARNKYCKVWVRNTNDRSMATGVVTQEKAQKVATTFEKIYEYETAIFGYEYGGGPNGNGGLDGDLAIQILVYDIDGDGENGSSENENVLGYFYSADEHRQSDLDKAGLGHVKSNEAEVFYIDAYNIDRISSTLVHEFQHMINFNRKTIEQGRVSGVWFNEMLSMLAEDLIDPLIEINIYNAEHPVTIRIPIFLESYNYSDPMVWLDKPDTLKSYSASYALGAYLVRNFGGIDFVKELMSNGLVDIASIDAALRSNANKTDVKSFTQALSRFGEALLFYQADDQRPPEVFSFNRTTDSKQIAGKNAAFYGFNYMSIPTTGPLIWNTDKFYSLHPRTLILQTNDDWQNRSGSLSITLRPPDASGIDMYIIVR